MKPPVGRTRPAQRKRVRLDLRRAASPPPPEDERAQRSRSNFWFWFGVVAVFHIALLIFFVFFHHAPDTAPPPPFFSLMPDGDVVKGTPGQQSAAKVGASTPSPSKPKPHPPAPHPETATQAAPPPPPAPSVTKVPPRKVHVKPVIQDATAPAVAQETKPAPPKPKPAPPKPKVKVDLTLADAPDADDPTPKPKHPAKAHPAPESKPTTDAARDDASTENDGLSPHEIAQRLGAKLAAEGVEHATHTGVSGDPGGHANAFSDFYASIREQAMDKWQQPNQNDPSVTDPRVQIHVEKDGRVPPERVVLLQGSGNQAIDDSALRAARAIGFTLQPLPDGCPPDISINFQISH